MRLNIPASTAVRFEPGEKKTVILVEIGGKRIIQGFNNLVNGDVSKENIRKKAFSRAIHLQFKGA